MFGFTTRPRLSFLFFLIVFSRPVQADFDKKYRLDIGASVVSFDSKIGINSRDGSVDEEVDFEDKLGFDTQVRMGFINGYWRMADRHRLSLLYVPIERTSEKTTGTDIVVDGDVIKAGAYVGASAKTHVFDIEYIYSYYKRPNLELGISAGIYWMNSLTELTAEGSVVYEGETQEELVTGFQANQRLVAPLPLIGLSAGYEVTPKWLIHAYARYFDITVSDVYGRVVSLSLKTEYFFTDHFALGAALTTFGVDVEHSGVIFFNTLNYEYQGLQAYIVMRY